MLLASKNIIIKKSLTADYIISFLKCDTDYSLLKIFHQNYIKIDLMLPKLWKYNLDPNFFFISNRIPVM